MAWKSREDKLPPPSYFSLIVAHLQTAYRGAKVSREMMTELRPFFIEAWRNGKTAEAAAQSTCSCNGHEIVPSPVVGVHIAKGAVRPPKGAQRGEVFGADSLRPPAQVERLQKRLGQIEQAQKKEERLGARWAQQAKTARKEATRTEAERKYSGAASKYTALAQEAQQIDAEIQRLRAELKRVERNGPGAGAELAASTAPLSSAELAARTHAAASERLTSSSASSTAAPRRRAASKRNRPAGASETPEGPPQSDEAMLSAIRSMLPDLAKQLAAEMGEEEPKK